MTTLQEAAMRDVLATARDALQDSIRWHNGDAWRNSEKESERNSWEDRRESLQEAANKIDDALRTALAQHREQQGWKRVPVEPTPEMLKAPPNAWEADAKITYAAMLAAAPAPQAQHSQYGSEDLQALILAKLTAPQAQEPAPARVIPPKEQQ